MSDLSDLIEFLFRLKAVELKEKEIGVREQQISSGFKQHDDIMRSNLENSKQTLEVIRLTRDLRLLTIVLIIIGIVQVWILISKP